MSKKSRVETLEEYLARGGSIQRIPSAILERQPDVIRTTTQGGPATFLTLEEADLFFGEASKNKKAKKVKPSLKIDLDALPPTLRAKFIAKLREETDGEGYEKELEEAGISDRD